MSMSMSHEEEGSNEEGGDSHAGGEGYLDSLPFMWTPPEGYSGDVRFVATVVQGFKTFFVGVESEVVTI